MTREIRSEEPYRDRLLKLIPTEMVGLYSASAAILGFVPQEGTSGSAGGAQQPMDPLNNVLIQVVFFVLLAAGPFYLRFAANVRNALQLALTTLSFGVWVYTLGGPFVVWGIHRAVIASLLLLFWSTLVPAFVKGTEPRPA